MGSIVMSRELRLDSSPLDLWPLISNTHRFNQAIGLPKMEVAGVAEDFGRKVTASLFGIGLSWIERPFEWVEGRRFNSIREFDSGPIARFEGGMRLSPDGQGCRLTISSEFTPNNALGEFIIKYAVGRKALADAERLVKRLDSSIKSATFEPYALRRDLTRPQSASLRQRTAALKEAPVSAAAVDRLNSFLTHAYDDEVTRMRPFELADRWGLDRMEALRVFLHGVKAGLLDMRWEINCPNCSAPKDVLGSLGGLKPTSHCPACDITYGVDFEECVELRFSVSPAIRAVETAVYCVGNPSQAPFAVAQLVLKPGAPREVEVDLFAESYRLRELGGKTSVWLRPGLDGARTLDLDLAKAGDKKEVYFRPGAVRLKLAPLALGGLARLERESWREKGAKASLITTLQEFRDLFSSEVLAPGVEIGVRTLAILFSDLKGSTALYEAIGDAAAYAMVRDHFDYMFGIIKRREGAVVKTIGDAVMAVFSSPAQALKAAVEMQERIEELNAALAPRPAVVIKLGVHQGPAIAINADDALDYFGTTVNVAARVQNESVGGDIVITEAMRKDPAVEAVLAGAKLEPFAMRLKGLSETFRLWRLTPAAGSSPAGA